MGLAILTAVGIVVLTVVAIRRAPDKITVSNTQALWMLRIALVLMGMCVVFLLYFGIGELIPGDLGGLIHLVPAILLVVLMFLAWRRPIEGGVILIILGVLISLYYGLAPMQGGGSFQVESLIGALPFLVSGILFLLAASVARRI